MSIVVGSIDLSSTSVVATSKYDYYKSDGGEIIGGVQTITIAGSVVVGDEDATTPGAVVMGKLRAIVDLGKEPRCINVSIPGQYSGPAKIENVTTNQGSDPSWINKGEFSIELKAPLQSIPANSLGITAQDSVTQISRSSKIEFPEDHHGYLYDGSFHKTYVIQSNELSFTCEPICQKNFSLVNVINKLIKDSPHPAISKSYNRYAKSKTVQVSGNSATIKTEYISTPHSGQAFTDLNFIHNKSYGDSPSTKKIISGTVTGLTDSAVFDTNGIVATCAASRLANAESVFTQIKGKFSDIKSWEGIELELNRLLNLPPATTVVSACQSDPDDPNKKPCLKPSLSTVSRSRTEGVIDFSFEWSSDDGDNCSASNNRISTDVTIDIVEPQPQFVEHVIPGFGTLIQNLNTRNARRINVQIVNTYPQDLCGPPPPLCEQDVQELLNKYKITNPILIKDTLTTSKRSVTKDLGYIECN